MHRRCEIRQVAGMAAIRMQPDGPMVVNGLSVDIEDWFQVGAFEGAIGRDDWDKLTPRVERNSDAVLNLFARAGVKATFFTLGWVARRHPALVRRIVDAGHELASHGWDHVRVFTMTPGEFRDDIAPKDIGTFVNLVLNGLALMRAGGEELPSTDLVLELLLDAIGPARARTPARTRA